MQTARPLSLPCAWVQFSTDLTVLVCKVWVQRRKNLLMQWAHLQPLIVAVRGTPAEVYYADRATGEAEHHGHRIVVAYCGYLWNVCVHMGRDTIRVFPQYPAHDVNVVDCAVVEDSTCTQAHIYGSICECYG